jgi:hypothetical protein
LWALVTFAGGHAFAEPKEESPPPRDVALIEIRARVSPDLQEIRGTITVSGVGSLYMVDPLSRWPEPEDDRQRLRTYPGRPEQGRVRFVQVGPGQWEFNTWLPRRYGDVGWRPNRALYANGGWYPQPLVAGRVLASAWKVSVTLPESALGALGTSVGGGELRWSGQAERASLAVLADGVQTRTEAAGVSLTLLTRNTPRRTWLKRPAALLSAARPSGHTLATTMVEAPLRRRLARPGAGVAFVSDRAWRLSPGLRRYHDRAVTRALIASALDNPDSEARAVAAEILARQAPVATDLLRRFRWNPAVDAILNDQTLPYWGDILGPGPTADPVQDDLLEVWDPVPPISSTVAAAELGLDEGARSFAQSLAAGRTVAEAWAEVGGSPGVAGDNPTSDGPSTANGWVATWAAWVSQANPTAGWIAGSASLWWRNRTHPRNVGSLALGVDQRSLPSLALGWTHLRGRPQDGLRRPHRLSLWVEPAWSNRRFTGTEQSVFTLGGGASWTWDSRVSELFPLEGGRVRVGASGGVAPRENTQWVTAGVSGVGLLSPHPRLVFAGRGYAGVASGTTTERLLWLGGPGAGSGLSPRSAYGTRLAVAEGEARLVPFRHASIPLGGWAWWSEWQVTGGLEVASLRAESSEVGFVGWTAGTAVVLDLLGARPGLGGVTVAGPLTTWGLDAGGSRTPQVTFRLGQSF